MKTFVLFIGITLYLSSFGQTHLIGIEAGPTFAKTARVDFPYYKILPAISGNLFYEYKKRSFTSSFGLGYINKGFQQELIFTDELGNILGEGALERVKHNYLSVSEILGVEYGEKYFGMAGIGIRASVYSNTIVKGDPFDLNDGTTVQGYRWELDYLRLIDLSALARVGIGMKAENGNIFYLSALYDFGLIKVDDSEFPSKHNNLTIQLGFKHIIINPFHHEKSENKI